MYRKLKDRELRQTLSTSDFERAVSALRKANVKGDIWVYNGKIYYSKEEVERAVQESGT